MNRRGIITIVFLSTLLLSALAPSGVSASIGEDYLFDPVLSLTGSAAVSAEDPIADPGSAHPPLGFDSPCGVATDRYGDIYVVATPGEGEPAGPTEGRIDVFDSQGNFLLEIPDENRPCQLAVDSVGNLYVMQGRRLDFLGSQNVVRYAPSEFPPKAGTTYSVAATLEFKFESGSDACKKEPQSLAVDPSNDHLYVGHECRTEEFGSAAEGTPSNPLIRCCIGEAPGMFDLKGIDVYGANHDVYRARTGYSDSSPPKVYVFDATDSHVKCELEGTETPQGEFDFGIGGAIGLDQSDGELFVYDIKHAVIDRFAPDGEGGAKCPLYSFAGQLPAFPKAPSVQADNVNLTVDSPCRKGPGLAEPCDIAPYQSPNAGEVYLTVGTKPNNSHLYAFKVKLAGPPLVREQIASEIGEEEALLAAELNPDGLQTQYSFQYTAEADFAENGWAGALSVPVPDATMAAGGAFLAVSEPVSGLQPDTAYRFRLLASNCAAEGAEPGACLTIGEGNPGGEGEDAGFSTYPTPLDDGRADELVTPPDTDGHVPTMGMFAGGFTVVGFATPLASPDGASLLFGSNSGALPGIGGGGGFQDSFRAQRGPGGWSSSFTGLTGAQNTKPNLGGSEPAHEYSFLGAEAQGTLVNPVGSGSTTYLRVPAGSPPASPNCVPSTEPGGDLEWIGCGSLDFEPRVDGHLISPGAGHVIFSTNTNVGPAKPLEPCAPPEGTPAIYDRTPGGPTRCVSLLPGDLTQPNTAAFKGASADGSAVAFTIAGDPNLYVRLDNAETLVATEGKAAFAGLSADGRRIFFLAEPSVSSAPAGEIFSCDLSQGSCAGPGASQVATQIGSGGESVVVNVSRDGSRLYFLSPLVLSGEEENEAGRKAQAGEENLYQWDEGAIRFIATVSADDVADTAGGYGTVGLGMWVGGVLKPRPEIADGPGADPSRTSADGGVLLFESRADLTDYESEGHVQVYRYEAAAPEGQRLLCLSCNPTGAAASADAHLRSRTSGQAQTTPYPPINALAEIANLSDDGKRAFFQSAERLLAADLDGHQDVYEWRSQGTGGCNREAGCLSLISGPRSAEDDYLYAATPDGHDVFFLSGDTLVPQDPDSTPSIYDARIGGGFPPPAPPPGECQGEACQPVVEPPPPIVSSLHDEGVASPPAKARCPKGKRRVRRAGKSRCVKRKAARHRREAGKGRRAGR